MSNEVFPQLIGLEWPVSKTPKHNNLNQKTATGMSKRLSLSSYPIWTFELSFAYLSDTGSQTDDVHTLIGFFNARHGSWDDFLFDDVTDNTVSNEGFGVGDGVTNQFQLVRSYGGNVEPVIGGVNGDPAIMVKGVALIPGSYTISTTGLVTFTSSAPPAGAKLTWSGQFYYRVHFVQDQATFENFMKGGWQNSKLELETVLNSQG